MLSSVLSVVAKRAFYDDSPAIVVRDSKLVSTRLRPGEPVAYTFTYDKRSDCHEPIGKSEISYRLWHFPRGAIPWFDWVSYGRPSRAPPGTNMRLDGPSVIPLPRLAAGSYAIQFRAVYHCARASDEQTIDGPMLPFEVVE